MTAHAYDVTVADFEQRVLDVSFEAPVLVDFWAEWCQPCRVLKPLLEKLAAEYGGRFVLAKVNSDQNPALSTRYGVRGIPAVKAFVGGQMVDEFTGALPEGQIREFIERLLPSPAEPLRRAAAEARFHDDDEAARHLLQQALAADPGNEAVRLDMAELCLESGAEDEAKDILETLADCRDRARLEALQARLRLVAAGAGADLAGLQQTLAAHPDDHAARLQLANALAVMHDYRAACEHLLEIVRRDRRWNDEAGRKTLLTLFSLLGGHAEYDDLMREYRVALARTLN